MSLLLHCDSCLTTGGGLFRLHIPNAVGLTKVTATDSWESPLSHVSDRFSRTENIQKNKDQAHRLKGVLQDSIVMLEQVGRFVLQGCEWAGW